MSDSTLSDDASHWSGWPCSIWLACSAGCIAPRSSPIPRRGPSKSPPHCNERGSVTECAASSVCLRVGLLDHAVVPGVGGMNLPPSTRSDGDPDEHCVRKVRESSSSTGLSDVIGSAVDRCPPFAHPPTAGGGAAEGDSRVGGNLGEFAGATGGHHENLRRFGAGKDGHRSGAKTAFLRLGAEQPDASRFERFDHDCHSSHPHLIHSASSACHIGYCPSAGRNL